MPSRNASVTATCGACDGPSPAAVLGPGVRMLAARPGGVDVTSLRSLHRRWRRDALGGQAPSTSAMPVRAASSGTSAAKSADRSCAALASAGSRPAAMSLLPSTRSSHRDHNRRPSELRCRIHQHEGPSLKSHNDRDMAACDMTPFTTRTPPGRTA